MARKEKQLTVTKEAAKTVEETFTPKEKDYTKAVYMTPSKMNQSCPMKASNGACFSGNVRNDGITGEFSGMNYPHSKEMLKVRIDTFSTKIL